MAKSVGCNLLCLCFIVKLSLEFDYKENFHVDVHLGSKVNTYLPTGGMVLLLLC